MDLGCLIGVCSAIAQTAGEVAAAAPVADAASAAASTPGEGEAKDDVGAVLVWIAIVTLLAAQLSANWVLRMYQRRLLRFMGSGSRKALGLGEAAEAAWTTERLLDGLERRRLAVLRVLVGVVAFYAVAAGLAWGHWMPDAKASAVSIAVSVLMFASLGGPVVLLGVSAANFARLFWVWVAPIAFATVAMQIVVIGGSGGEPADWRRALWAIGGVAALTGAGVALREWVPAAHWRHVGAWLAAHRRLAWALAAVAVLVLLAVLGELTGDPDRPFLSAPTTGQLVFVGCLASAAAIGLCYVTMVDRLKRIVVPLLAVALFSFTLFVAAFGVGLVEALGAAPSPWAVAAAIAVAFVLALLAANFILGWIGLAYEQKLFSDAQFQVFCWMLAVSGVVIGFENVVNGVKLDDPLNLWLFGATAAALLGYWLVTRYGIRPLDSDKRLLVLRVFAQDSRGERLLDEIEYRWRFIGPIVLIGGPDIAMRTIDPAKAANFLRGRLRDTFVPNRHMLHKQVAAMDETPDPDGRYRVNEFFCFDDLWKEAVQRLLDASDAIVLDLRGFTAARRGTAYELGLLKERGALARTVMLRNPETNHDDVCAALGLPPGSRLPAGAVIDVERSMDGRQLVEELVRRIPVEAAGPARAEEAVLATRVA